MFWSRGGGTSSRVLHSPPAGQCTVSRGRGSRPAFRRALSSRRNAVLLPTCGRMRPRAAAGPACPSAHPGLAASGPREGPGALLTSPCLGPGPTGEARSLRAVCSYPRGLRLAAPGGPTHPPQSARPPGVRSALRLRRSCTPSASPAPQGRVHPLPPPAVGVLASQLNLFSQPSPAPAAHPALFQVPADQSAIQRDLYFPSPPRRGTRPCPLFFDPSEGWTPGTLLFAPSCSSAPTVGQIHPEFSEIP